MSPHIRPTFCNHYLAMSEHDTCEAGVAYDSLKHLPFDKRPCFRRKGEAIRPGCDLVEFPTPAQEAEYEAELTKRITGTFTARQAIVDHLGGPWTKGTRAAAGVIPCPVCGSGELKFSRAGYNGHIHAACSTEGCVSWMQ